MINHHISPKTPAALEAVTKHGAVMALVEQRGVEVLLCCATASCPCWSGKQRWRKWFRLNQDVTIRPVGELKAVEHELANATAFKHDEWIN